MQVTREARAAGLAEEATGDDLVGPERWESLSEVWVYGFGGLLLVIDQDIPADERAELVATTARDTGTIYGGEPARIRTSGNGCEVSLPGIEHTGLRKGDRAPVTPAPGLLVVQNQSMDTARLADDLASIRRDQVGESAT